mgnify:CR=1 FL=1
MFIAYLFFALTVSAESLQEKDQKAKDRYSQAKSSYVKVINEYKSAKTDFLKAKDKYVQYKDGNSLKATLEQAKNYLSRSIDVALSHIEVIQSNSNTIPLLTEDQRKTTNTELNFEKDWLIQKKAQLPSATTKDQLVSHGKEVQNHWIAIRIKTKKMAGEILIAHINWVIAKGDNASVELQTNIDSLKTKGKDTSTLEKLLADLNKNLVLAKQKRDSAIATFNQIGVSGATTLEQLNAELKEANELFKKGKEFIRQANQYVRSAHKDLKEAVKQIRSQTGSSSSSLSSSLSSSSLSSDSSSSI